jgi:phage regulator Rha-like protein
MKNKQSITLTGVIENRIFTIRETQVMLDSHLAELYGVETKVINQAVKRNAERFPSTFLFQINEKEWENLKSQTVTSSSEHGGRRYLPYAFTEQGVAMLSAVLKSTTAIKVSIQIMKAFVEMRKFIGENAAIFHRLDKVERKQIEADEKFDRVFTALEKKDKNPEKGIFFDGQIYDAYSFIAGLIRNAGKSIILIDNYIDDTVLTLFTKRKKGVKLTIYTKAINKQLQLDIIKHNAQYEPIQVMEHKHAHDRFLIIYEKELYHIGASIKDIGKKWFAFSKMSSEVFSMLEKLKQST